MVVADDDVRVPAGWYPDPLGLPQLRWWDNHSWTEHTSDARQPVVDATHTVSATEATATQTTPVITATATATASSVPASAPQQHVPMSVPTYGVPQRQQAGQPIKAEVNAPPPLAFADDTPFADDLADLEDTGFPQAAFLHDLAEPDPFAPAGDLPSRREMRAQERLMHDDDVIRDLAGDVPRFGDPIGELEAHAHGEPVIADSPAMRYAASTRIDDAPRSRRYDLDERHEDLLGEPSEPRSAFDHASASTTTFIPESGTEHRFDEWAAGARVDGGASAADAPGPHTVGQHTTGHRSGGARRMAADAAPATGTVAAWVLTLIPIYMLLVGMTVLLSGATAPWVPITLSLVLGVPWMAGIAIAALDRRTLVQHGMEHPAHWLWSLLGAPVYLVARLVATVRETGAGFGPVLTFIVLGFVMVGAVVAVPGLAMELAPATFSAEAERSIEDDALSFGRSVTVECPDTPPLLVQQSFTCVATSPTGDSTAVRVSLQRSNGWIDWRVDDWSVFTMGN